MFSSHTTQLPLVFALFAIASVCTAIEPVHDGSSVEKAIIVTEPTYEKCVDAENAYIQSHYPNVLSGDFEHSTLIGKQGRWYDWVHFTTADGKKHELYFDSSGCK